MALLPEAPANAGAGQDPATAYAPPPAEARAEPAEARTIEVVARRFAFEPVVIEASVGERLRLLITSADGVHGLGIRKFKVNVFIPRGRSPVAVEFVASEAGSFPILCTEACGDGHADMRGTLVVTTRGAQPGSLTPR